MTDEPGATPPEQPPADDAAATTPPAPTAPPAPDIAWGGTPTAAPAGWTQPAPPQAPPTGWGQPAPPPTPPQPAPSSGWGQAGTPVSSQAPAVPAAGSGWAVAQAPSGPPQGSILVALSGVLLIIIGLLVGLIGVGLLAVGAVARSVFDNAVNNGTLAGYSADVIDFLRGFLIVLGVIVGLYGLGELIAGLGVLMKRQWGRILGILLAILPALFFTIALPSAAGRDTGGGLIFVLVFAIAYWFIVVALATGGRAFRHG